MKVIPPEKLWRLEVEFSTNEEEVPGNYSLHCSTSCIHAVVR